MHLSNGNAVCSRGREFEDELEFAMDEIDASFLSVRATYLPSVDVDAMVEASLDDIRAQLACVRHSGLTG